MSFYDSDPPNDDEAREASEVAKRNRERKAINQIVALLDGEEWSADTCDAIAQVLRAAGHEIREVV